MVAANHSWMRKQKSGDLVLKLIPNQAVINNLFMVRVSWECGISFWRFFNIDRRDKSLKSDWKEGNCFCQLLSLEIEFIFKVKGQNGFTWSRTNEDLVDTTFSYSCNELNIKATVFKKLSKKGASLHLLHVVFWCLHNWWIGKRYSYKTVQNTRGKVFENHCFSTHQDWKRVLALNIFGFHRHKFYTT